MRALKWADTDTCRIIVVAVSMARISEAPKLKCAAGFERLTMHDTCCSFWSIQVTLRAA